MTLATGTLQDSAKTSLRQISTGQTAVAVVNPDGSEISAGGSGGSSGTITNQSAHTAISVTSTPVEAKVGASSMANRKFVMVTPVDGIVYFGSDNTVTTSTGTPIPATVSASFSFSDNVPVWLVSSGTVDVRIIEGS